MLIIKVNHGNDKIIKKVKEYPFYIGRSVQNNLIIDEDSISGKHAVININEDGIFIQDLDSTNGIKIEDQKTTYHTFHDNIKMTLGEVEVEFVLEEENLEKTRVITLPEEFRKQNKFGDIQLSVLFSIFVIFIVFLNVFIDMPLGKEAFLKIFGSVTVYFVIILSWSLIMGVISKVQLKKYNFFKFLSISSIIVFTSMFFTLVSRYLFFYVNSREFTNFVSGLMTITFLLIFIYLNLMVFFEKKSRVKVIKGIGVGFSILFAGFILVSVLDDKKSGFNYDSTFEYPIFQYERENYPIQRVFDKIDSSIKDVDEFRVEELEKWDEQLKEYNEAIN